jgi:hypothetical protein
VSVIDVSEEDETEVIDLTQDDHISTFVYEICDNIIFLSRGGAVVDAAIRQGGIALVTEAAKKCPELMYPTYHAATAAALWISFKFLGTQVTSPGCKLMAMGAKVRPESLREKERQVMAALEWDIVSVLKREHIVNCLNA